MKSIRALAQEVRNKHPEQDSHFKVTHLVAGLVVKQFLGIEWMQKHVMGYSAPTDFFRNDWADTERFETHVLRLVALANLLANLQFVPGFNEVRAKIKTDNIESAIAELETARLLLWNRATFRFVPRQQKLGMDYDVEVVVGDQVVCADTKCKLETTEKTVDTIVGTLRKARSQVPEDKPAIVFLKVPQRWDVVDDSDPALIALLEEASRLFFYGYGRYKGTSHVVMVVFYLSVAKKIIDRMSEMIVVKYFINEKHRHAKDMDWKSIAARGEGLTVQRPSLWIDVVELCK